MARKKNQRTSQKTAPDAAGSPRHWLADRYAIAFLALLVLLTFANSLTNEFTFDDRPYIAENKYITDLKYLKEIFTKPFPPHMPDLSLYRPLAELSFMLDRAIGLRESPFALYGFPPEVSTLPFHITNLLIHFGVCVLIYVLIKRLYPSRYLPFFAAAIFAVHPVHVEVVASIVGRAESLCALFFLLAILFYLRRTPGETYTSTPTLLSLACFFCALLSKETAIVLPLVLIMLENMRKENSLQSRIFPSRIVAYVHTYLPYLAVAILYMTIRVWVVEEIGIRKDMAYFAQRPGIQFITAMPIVFSLYMKLLIFPLTLNADYNFPILLFDQYFIEAPKTILSLWVLIGLATVIGYLGLTIYAAARRHPLAIALLWFLITLLPVSNIIPFGDIMAERFLYLPSIGFCAVVGGLLARGVERYGTRARPKRVAAQFAWAIFVCLVLLYALRSAVRNRDWKDEVAFWKTVMHVAPTNNDAYYGLAHSYADKRKEALKKGNVLKEQGKFSQSKRYLDHAASYEQKAIESYYLTVRKDPAYYEAYVNLATLLIEAKEPNYLEARRLYREGLNQYPRNWKYLDVFYYGIGLTYAFSGDYHEAAEYFKTAIRFKSQDPKYHINLGSAYANLGQFELARKEWKYALDIDPTNTEAIKNLEKLKGVLDQAKERQREAQTP